MSTLHTHDETVNSTEYNAIEKRKWQVVTIAETGVKFFSKACLSTSYLRLASIFLSFLLVWVSGSLLQINDKDISKIDFLPVAGNMYFRNLFLYQFIVARNQKFPRIKSGYLYIRRETQRIDFASKISARRVTSNCAVKMCSADK